MSETSNSLTHIRRKTVTSLLRTWQEVRGTAFHVFSSEIRAGVPKEDEAELRKRMMLCLDSPGGEVTARANTAELGRIYLGLNEAGRLKFLKMLATDFDVNHEQLVTLTKAFSTVKNDDRPKLEMDLRAALVTPRTTILKQFSALPDGIKFLVNLRADLLPIMSKDTKLKGLEFDLKQILASWFDVALLDLVEINWQTPAAILEKLIEYEAVHKVSSWQDLKNRLDADRRVYAFFHHKMPDEPLIFVHVALVDGMSDNVQTLLDEKSPLEDVSKADTAIFYSISNAQKGLAGISFGNFLIKRVVSKLTQEMPHIKTFATLSPIPAFRQWLDPLLIKNEKNILTKDEAKKITDFTGKPAPEGLHGLLEGEWYKNAKAAALLKPILLRFCTKFLLEEKRAGKPLDPVANFHLFNGARLERINWLADISAKGLQQSAGLMVNYYYKLSEIDENHEAFADDGKIVASRSVRGYL